MSVRRPSIVVWDLGGVLIDWDPNHLYRKLIPDKDARERFLAEVCSPAWNHRQDAGRPFAEGIAELSAAYPGQASMIEAYFDRWDEMLGGPIEGSVAILEELAEAGVRQLALTNWSHETFPRARGQFPFLERFEGIVVSGEEGVAKPDPGVYGILLSRHDLSASTCVFVDDSARNVESAAGLGFDVIRFTSPADLRARLVARGLFPN